MKQQFPPADPPAALERPDWTMGMAMKLGTDMSSRIGLLGAAALALTLSASVSRPALALEDDGKENIFSSVIGLVMPGEDPAANIEYRERAPIVVPKNRAALPAPQPKAAEKTKAWPKNQEIARKEAERARAMAPRVDEVWNPVSRTELDRVRSQGGVQGPGADTSCSEPLGRPCNQEAFWSSLKNTRSASDDTKDLVPGKEASRQFLTDPPAGYRKPTTAQKYSFEIKKEDDITDARAQAIQDKRRREDR
jgi:hypothetical protein